ncbi:serine hydrolase domain-containing protein [Streptomyces sp. VNUA116]|uniref:serine hydrolase domain-containing protein n=1 Tax=Streptomyces sp. VNUA116 TaxID=3062449 RepID=UPI002676726C|nr:serine hydrolase domain-containing protein [Streptomyces sp. VNUA116]WKU48902.1 serine hydrolase domain-containing protein [Streptomyces sp. VNUA116]
MPDTKPAGTKPAGPFLSAAWLAAGRSLERPPAGVRDTVTLRLEITDPPPGAPPAVDVDVDLAAGRLGVATAGGEPPGLRITLPHAAARALLLGSPQERVGVFERGDVRAEGNFSLLFFVDAALRRDGSGHVAALRAAAGPAGPREASPTEGAAGAEETAGAAEAVEHAREALPGTVHELEREVGASTPGAQLHVSLDGVTLADAGLGEARPGVPMTHRSLPLWYCCAKPLLSAALGRLWEAGAYDPYLPVAHYVPAFGRAGKESITSMDLLTHTGPLPTGDDPLHGVVAGPDDERLRRALGVAVPPRSRRAPGVNYSQWWAWFVLARILPVVDGREYRPYVEQEILGPCGMTGTRVHLTPDDFTAFGDRLPLIHVSNPRSAPQPTHWWSTEAATTRCIPGVNTRGPLSDLGRFLAMLLRGGDAPGGRVLAPPTVAALTARHRTGLRDRYGNADWGMGFRLECRHLGEEFTSFGTHTSPRSYGHDGLWTAVAFADPDAGLTVAVHLNGKVEHERHRERILRIADAVYRDLRLC